MFKHIKKFVSSVLTATLLVSTVSVAGIAADDGTQRKVITTDNFQTYNKGASTVGSYGGGAKGNLWKLEEEANGNKYFAMTVNTSSDAHLDGSFGTTIEGKFVFQFDMRFRDYGPVTKWLYFIDGGGKDIFILDINPNGTITTHNGVSIGKYALNKWYTIVVELDCQTGLMNVKFNNKWRVLDHPVGACAPTKWRFHMRSPSGVSTVDLDNLAIYTGAYTMENVSQTESTTETPSASASTADPYSFKYDLNAMYIGKDSTLVKGQQVYISQNDEIVPYRNGEVKMVPVKAFTESLGGTATWDSADSSAVFTAKGKTVKLFNGKRTCLVDGVEKTLMCAADVGAGNVFYAPAKDLCEFFGQFFHEEDNGLIIYSDNDHSADLDWNTNMKGMRNLCESFMFDDVTGAEIAAMIESRYPIGANHPRLIFTEEKFAQIRAHINDPNGDPIYKKMFEELKHHCERYMKQATSGYEIRDNIRLLYVVRENADRMLGCAIMYNLTGDEKYAHRAYQEMYTSACFKDFNPYHFLDVGEMAACLGLTYDWLYNWMTEDQRTIIRNSIIKKGIYPIIEDFDGLPRSRSWNWRGELADNWCLVISGVAVGAMAVVDEAPLGLERTNCERAIEQCLIDTRRALSLFAPYGAYEEGINYWDYAMRFYVQTMESLKTAVGDDFGYSDVVGMEMTDEFVYAVNGSVSKFSYHDCGEGGVSWFSPLMWLAKTFNDPSIAQPRLEAMQKGSSGQMNIVWDMYLYDPSFLQATTTERKLDVCLPIAEIATMRSGFDEGDMWLGFHCDNPMGDGGGHDHMDSGAFVLDSQGVNWFFDLGADSYNIPNYSQSYRVRGEGHNIVIFNPTANYSLKAGGRAQIDEFESAGQGAYAIGNLDDAHRDDIGVISHRRGAKLDDMRRVATIQDEIRLAKPGEMYWFAHTRADIEISEDGKSAILSKEGKQIIAKIVNGDGAKFTVMDPKPLPTSPQNDKANPNNGVRKLTIHMEDVQNIDLCVSFADYYGDLYESNINMKYTPLADWKAPEGELPDMSFASLTGIYLDGELIEGFDPNTYKYIFGGENLEDLNKVVTATCDGEVFIDKPEGATTATIIAKGTTYQKPRIYTVKFNIGGGVGEPKGKPVIQPKTISVSDIPQPENAPENLADGDLTTKWAAEGTHWLEYDLGSVKDLDSVGIAFMEGDTRTAQFEIHTSEDGENYKMWFDGDALPTLDLENHKLPGAKARYVKIVVKGYNNNPGNWNSVMEVRVYGA